MYWFDSIKISRERITTADGETTSILRLMTNKNRNNNNATLQVRPLSNKAKHKHTGRLPGKQTKYVSQPLDFNALSTAQGQLRTIKFPSNTEMHISKLFSCANPFLQSSLQQRDLLAVPGRDS